MTTLTIRDLPRTESLDQKALSAVRGGTARYQPGPYWFSSYDASMHDKSIDVSQSIGQNQEVFNANGNNVFAAAGIESTVKPVQKASNNVFA